MYSKQLLPLDSLQSDWRCLKDIPCSPQLLKHKHYLHQCKPNAVKCVSNLRANWRASFGDWFRGYRIGKLNTEHRILNQRSWQKFLVMDAEGQLISTFLIKDLKVILRELWSETLIQILVKLLDPSFTVQRTSYIGSSDPIGRMEVNCPLCRSRE